MTTTTRSTLCFLPNLLTGARIILGPVIWYLVTYDEKPAYGVIVFLLFLAFATEVLDGKLARRLKTTTSFSSAFDSFADAWYFLWVGWALILKRHALFVLLQWPFTLLVVLQVTSWLVDLILYRQVTHFHTNLSKTWGVVLFLAVLTVFMDFHSQFFLWLVIIVGYLCNLEGAVIKMILRQPMSDIKTILQAQRIQWSQMHVRKSGDRDVA